MRTKLHILAGLLGALLSSAALGDCIDGMRSATPGEAEYHKRVSAALQGALPAAPPNWTLAPGRESSVGGMCR